MGASRDDTSHWLAQTEHHEADAEALLAAVDGHDPNEPFVRYCLDAAAVRAQLATAAASAATAARHDPGRAVAGLAEHLRWRPLELRGDFSLVRPDTLLAAVRRRGREAQYRRRHQQKLTLAEKWQARRRRKHTEP